MPEIRFANRYWCDLDEISSYYKHRGIHLASGFEAAVKQAIEAIQTFPESSRKHIGDLRRRRLKRFPYYIGYCVEGDLIVVVGVVHTSRDDSAWVGYQSDAE